MKQVAVFLAVCAMMAGLLAGCGSSASSEMIRELAVAAPVYIPQV